MDGTFLLEVDQAPKLSCPCWPDFLQSIPILYPWMVRSIYWLAQVWNKFGELIEDLYRKGFELLSEKDNCWFRNYRWIHYLLKNDSWRLIELGCTNLAPVRINLLYRQSFMKRKNKWRNPSTRWMEWLPKPIQLVWRRSQSDEVKLKTHGVRLFL